MERSDRTMLSKKLESETVAVVDWFIKHNVPSISPQTSLHLISIAEKVKEEIEKDPETPQTIKAYATALHMVAKAGHIQQGVVIEQFKRLVSSNRKEVG